MKRINEIEAQDYIPCDIEFSNGIATFFTLTPDDDGWEKVTYYTSKKFNQYVNSGGFDSWVYILSNPTMMGYYKIGYTNRTPEERAKELSRTTSTPLPFKVEWAFPCYRGDVLEKIVHKRLEGYRTSTQKEFFQLPLNEAIEVILEEGEKYV